MSKFIVQQCYKIATVPVKLNASFLKMFFFPFPSRFSFFSGALLFTIQTSRLLHLYSAILLLKFSSFCFSVILCVCFGIIFTFPSTSKNELNESQRFRVLAAEVHRWWWCCCYEQQRMNYGCMCICMLYDVHFDKYGRISVRMARACEFCVPYINAR